MKPTDFKPVWFYYSYLALAYVTDEQYELHKATRTDEELRHTHWVKGWDLLPITLTHVGQQYFHELTNYQRLFDIQDTTCRGSNDLALSAHKLESARINYNMRLAHNALAIRQLHQSEHPEYLGEYHNRLLVPR